MVAKYRTYKSGLELDFSFWLDNLGWSFLYEPVKIPYIVPEKHRTYTPDFVIDPKNKRRIKQNLTLEELEGKIIIETKGILDIDNRNKLLYVKENNPNLDIRLVFQKDNFITPKKKKKNPKTGMRYSEWCEQNGFKYHIGVNPPKSWFKSE